MMQRIQLGVVRGMMAAACLIGVPMYGQTAAQKESVPKTEPVVKAPAPKMPVEAGTELDRIVAIVNGDLILDSDVNQEMRFAALLPYDETAMPGPRDEAIERLISRDLVLQQSKLQPEAMITLDEAKADLNQVRDELPTCKEFHCKTQEGWDKFLATQGFDEDTIVALWQQRMEVLAFIEQRFKMGIKITPEEIKAYYDSTIVPSFAKSEKPAPLLDAALSGRLQQILLEQRVTKLFDDWLKSLRTQGSVVVLHPGEGAP